VQLDAAREAVAWLDRHATYTRTGHHSARTGEWRGGDGLVASVFLHHISRDGDPHLHVHVAVWNRVQRADGADNKWRTLDSRSLHNQRLAVAPVTDRMAETRLSVLGYAMVPRADGAGRQGVAGVLAGWPPGYPRTAAMLDPVSCIKRRAVASA
jgi:hypothetical protein